MSQSNGHMTPIQLKMLDVLSDGMSHTHAEMFACLSDDMGHSENIHAHITGIRKMLRRKGQDIICERGPSGSCYRQVRYISLPD